MDLSSDVDMDVTDVLSRVDGREYGGFVLVVESETDDWEVSRCRSESIMSM